MCSEHEGALSGAEFRVAAAAFLALTGENCHCGGHASHVAAAAFLALAGKSVTAVGMLHARRTKWYARKEGGGHLHWLHASAS